MNVNYSWLALGLAVIVGLVAMFNSNTKVRKNSRMGFVALLLISGALFYFAPTASLGTNSLAITGQESQATQTNSGGINIVTTNPTVSITGRNSQYSGTTFSTSNRVSTNGGAFASVGSVTTVVPGQTLSLLVNASGYHSQIVENLPVKSDTFPLTVDMNKNATVTITAFNTNNQVIDGTTYNQTVTAGFSPNINVKFNGQSQTNTQDMTCVLEESNKTAVDTKLGITMAGATPVTIPLNFYTLAGVGSYVQTFDIPALTSSSDVFHAIQVNSATTSGYSLAGSTLKINCYTKENFVDGSTGKLTYAIQDSTGSLQSIASYSKTIVFQ